MILSDVYKGILDNDGARDVELRGGGVEESRSDADGQVGMDALGDGTARLGLGGNFPYGVSLDDILWTDQIVGMPLLWSIRLFSSNLLKSLTSLMNFLLPCLLDRLEVMSHFPRQFPPTVVISWSRQAA